MNSYDYSSKKIAIKAELWKSRIETPLSPRFNTSSSNITRGIDLKGPVNTSKHEICFGQSEHKSRPFRKVDALNSSSSMAAAKRNFGPLPNRQISSNDDEIRMKWLPKASNTRRCIFRLLDAHYENYFKSFNNREVYGFSVFAIVSFDKLYKRHIRVSILLGTGNSDTIQFLKGEEILSSLPEYRYPRYGDKENDTALPFELVLFAVPITLVTQITMEEYNRSKVNGYFSNLSRTVIKFEGNRINRFIRKDAKQTAKIENLKSNWWPTYGDLPTKVFLVFEDYHSGKFSKFVQSLVNLATLVTVAAIAIESLPQYRFPHAGLNSPNDSLAEFQAIALVCNVIFSIEMGFRLMTVWFAPASTLNKCGYSNVKETLKSTNLHEIRRIGTLLHDGLLKKGLKWMFHVQVMLDWASLLPFYIEVLRLLRMIRVLRLLKQSEDNSNCSFLVLVRCMFNNYALSFRPLAYLTVIFATWIILASSIAFTCEQGKWNEEKGYYERDFFGNKEVAFYYLNYLVNQQKQETPFRSIPETFYWSIVTLTTVGYGDMVPSSTEGRVATAIIALLSVLSLAIPIGIVSVNMEKASEKFRMWKLRRAAAMRDDSKVKMSYIVHGNPSIKFFDEIALHTGNMEDSLVKIVQMIDFHSNFVSQKDPLLLRQMFTMALRRAISGPRVCFIFWFQYVKNKKRGKLNSYQRNSSKFSKFEVKKRAFQMEPLNSKSVMMVRKGEFLGKKELPSSSSLNSDGIDVSETDKETHNMMDGAGPKAVGTTDRNIVKTVSFASDKHNNQVEVKEEPKRIAAEPFPKNKQLEMLSLADQQNHSRLLSEKSENSCQSKISSI
eukprot:jgi/Bigna1/147169/aug1.131_g21877